MIENLGIPSQFYKNVTVCKFSSMKIEFDNPFTFVSEFLCLKLHTLHLLG